MRFRLLYSALISFFFGLIGLILAFRFGGLCRTALAVFGRSVFFA
jgi:hypothetical protein